MASGEYRRPQSDSGVSFRCLRLKCELYLNVCLSISISLCPAHRLFNSFSTLRSTKITLSPSLSLHYAIGELIKSQANWQIVNCDFCLCISEFFFFFMCSTRIQSHFANALFLFYFLFAFWNVSDHTNNGFTDPLPGIWHMAYARHRRNIFSSWSVNQLTSCAGSAVPRRWLSQN